MTLLDSLNEIERLCRRLTEHHAYDLSPKLQQLTQKLKPDKNPGQSALNEVDQLLIQERAIGDVYEELLSLSLEVDYLLEGVLSGH